MIIIRISGGLGNQMFQYALYRSMKEKGIEAYVDLSWFDNFNIHNGYELKKIFKIEPDLADESYAKRIGETDYRILSRLMYKITGHKKSMFIAYGKQAVKYIPAVFEMNNRYISGYWQSEKYFINIRNLIKKEFEFPLIKDDVNLKIEKQIKECNSVSLHVRRGDYANEPLLNGVCDLNYYRNALKYIKERIVNPTFFCFSNDIKWCKDNFSGFDIEFISNNHGDKSYIDMQLMSMCKNHIIANSSFSWWGAWLQEREEGCVVTPKHWFKGTSTEDIIPERWVRI